jgi:hypothetical protein
MNNAQGAKQIITTLTAVAQKVSEQKFYEIPFAEFVPVIPGVGAFDVNILNWRSFSKDGGFEKGLVGSNSNRAQRSQSDAVFDAVLQKTQFWAKNIEWSAIELEQAAKANNLFSLVEAREMARKKSWDLGIQRVAFLGLDNDAGIKGLLNNASVYNDTATITVALKNMTTSQLQTFISAVYEKYRANCNRTAKPSKFIIPEAEFNGLHSFPDLQFPFKTRFDIIEEMFKKLTGNQGFKIMACAYCDKANFDGTNNRYVLTVDDPTSLALNLPIDYTTTQAGTEDGFSWVNTAYGQFSGVVMLRDLETYYFSNTLSL